MPDTFNTEPDAVLIGAGIMSATLGVLLKELEPSLNIEMFETLEGAGLESSDSWNNAGTGHAANCELNYTPERTDGSIDISKALQINVEFDLSRQLWSYIVKKGSIKDPRTFIHPVPHMSFVWGADNVSFLRKRFTEYLIGQVLQSESHRLAAWTSTFPMRRATTGSCRVAGQRVEIIKPDIKRGGALELGTELVAAADRSLVALLGASPGASTAAFIAISE
jgi:malate dehydrogenase (quinone)